MPAIDILLAEWLSFSSSISLFGLLALYFSDHVPPVVQRVFRYGKCADDFGRLRPLVQVPKRFFSHFYVFALVFYLAVLYAVLLVYVRGERVPLWTAALLDAFVGPQRRASLDATGVLLATTAMTAQACRRLYECVSVSVFSRATMNVLHYFAGFSFYFGVGLSLLAEAPAFAFGHVELRLRAHHCVGVALFFVASLAQHKCHQTLADLRKDSAGHVVTLRHSIPRAGLFDLISCPHFLSEIMIYCAVAVVLNWSFYWSLVCLFVTCNQVVMALCNHCWYRKHFPNEYPKHRKAIFPFLL